MSAIVNALKKALQADPSDWENRLALIETYVAADQHAEAIDLLNEVEELPEEIPALIAAGRCYAAVGSVEDGIGIIQAVIDADPDNAAAHLAMAEMGHALGDANIASAHYQTAKQLDSSISSPELEKEYPAQVTAITSDQLVEDDSEDGIEIAAPVKLQPPTAADDTETPSGAKTVSLAQVPAPTTGETLDDLANKSKSAVAPSPEKTLQTADAPVLEVTPEDEIEFDSELEEEARFIAECKESVKENRKKAMARDKVVSLTITILVHVAVFAALTLVVIAVPRDVPPSLVAQAAPSPEEEQIDHTTLERTKITNTTATATVTNVVSAVGVSNFAVPDLAVEGDISAPAQDIGFAPSMNFSSAMSAPTSMMMFGEPIEGEVLGVILDVSGSMAEFLPMVIREVDKNYKNAPVVFINHAKLLGAADSTRIYPIVEKEVMPHWPKEWEKGNSPFWFLWHDLPRKAPQRSVDRLIETFKTRQNMFIARGGNNRIAAAADFLAEQNCDSLYVFSDFEDFVDEDLAADLGQRLGRKKIKTYVQPAAQESEHLNTVHNKIARRTLGRKLPALSDILRPKDDGPEPIAVKVDKPTPVPEGVTLATRRPTRDIDKDYYYHSQSYFKDELKVFEYPRFDIALHGPEARAYIYLKDKDGYLQRPVVFGYHSAKYTMGTDNRLHWRRRKFIRHIEEPKLDGNEFTWNMMLEDDLEFKVVFWFKEDTATGTYVAEKPAEGERDDAHIYFIIPPLAREKNDRYYAPDYPADGLKLDEVRTAVSDNRAIFHLPGTVADRYETSWERLGFKRGHNVTPYNVLYGTLPNGVREVTVQGPSFAKLRLHARTTSNKLLLSARGFRNDIELWEGFICRLVKPGDDRDRFTKTEAIEFSVSEDDSF